MAATHYRDLICWQLAQQIRREVFAITAVAPTKSDFDFCHDIRCSARSAPANIAEGLARETHPDFAKFLSHARASLTETENHLADALECGYLTRPEFDWIHVLIKRALKATTRLQSYLLRTPDYRRPIRWP